MLTVSVYGSARAVCASCTMEKTWFDYTYMRPERAADISDSDQPTRRASFGRARCPRAALIAIALLFAETEQRNGQFGATCLY